MESDGPGHRAPVVPGGAPVPQAATAPGVPRRRARHRARRSRPRAVLLALLGGLVIVAGFGIGLGTEQVDRVAEGIGRIGDPFPAEDDRPGLSSAAEQARTFLVVGVDPVDVRTGAVRAEAVLLVRLTGDREHVQVVSFPLDAWVGGTETTLEGAYDSAGPPGAVRAVEALTGVRVDHYAELDYAGFATAVDALGGVPVDVAEPYRNRGHSFAPGLQQMDGAEALAYLRDADAGTRAGAPARQQRVVQGLFTRLGELDAFADLVRLTELLGSVTTALRVDDSLSDEQLVATAWEFRRVGDPDFLTVPVAGPGTEGGQPVQYLDDDRAAALWRYLREDALAGHLGEFS